MGERRHRREEEERGRGKTEMRERERERTRNLFLFPVESCPSRTRTSYNRETVQVSSVNTVCWLVGLSVCSKCRIVCVVCIHIIHNSGVCVCALFGLRNI